MVTCAVGICHTPNCTLTDIDEISNPFKYTSQEAQCGTFVVKETTSFFVALVVFFLSALASVLAGLLFFVGGEAMDLPCFLAFGLGVSFGLGAALAFLGSAVSPTSFGPSAAISNFPQFL
jgi:hypothetical protein